MRRMLLSLLITGIALPVWALDPFDLMMQQQEELREKAMAERESYLYPGGERFSDTQQKNGIITLRWFAAAGDVDSQAAMGDIFAQGIYEPQNLRSAVYWYGLAAKFGNAYAQYMMGISYQQGWLGQVDAVQANEWFKQANRQEDRVRAMRQVGQFFNERDNAMYNFDQAFHWTERAALAGDLDSQLVMADWYFDGDRVGRDILTALKWYGRAAAQDSPYAQYSLGLIYLKGDPVVPQDYEQAYQWLQKAAWQGYAAAQYTLGELYYTGKGVVANNVLAYAWWTLANDFKNPAVAQDISRITKKMSMEEIEQAVKLSDYYASEIG